MGERSIGQPSPLALGIIRWCVRPMVKLFHRPTIRGIENLPQTGPYLLVANHSAGMAAAELSSFAHLYVEKIGLERRLNGFALASAFHFPGIGWILRTVGAVPSTYDDAYRALDDGLALLVFPGGDHEALRPIWQAGRVDFAGRKGFLKIAQQAGVRPWGFGGAITPPPFCCALGV